MRNQIGFGRQGTVLRAYTGSTIAQGPDILFCTAPSDAISQCSGQFVKTSSAVSPSIVLLLKSHEKIIVF